jgi:hypothetical protein
MSESRLPQFTSDAKIGFLAPTDTSAQLLRFPTSASDDKVDVCAACSVDP